MDGLNEVLKQKYNPDSPKDNPEVKIKLSEIEMKRKKELAVKKQNKPKVPRPFK